MVRNAGDRIRKYEAKMDPTVIGARFTAQKDDMVAQETVKFAELEAIEIDIKAITDGDGIATIRVPFYLACGRQFYKINQNFTGTTQDNEFDIVRDKWVARGLLDATIIDIAALFGVTLT